MDLLVIMPFRGKAVYQAARIRSGLKTGYPVDVIVHSREEIDTRLAEGDPFIQEIIEQGKILYEANNP